MMMPSSCEYDQDHANEVMQLIYVAILEKKAVYRFESGLRTRLFAVIRDEGIPEWYHRYPVGPERGPVQPGQGIKQRKD